MPASDPEGDYTVLSDHTDQSLTFPIIRNACPFAPPEQYASLRSERPAARITFPDGTTAWLLTRHSDVRKVLADPRVSNDRQHPGFPEYVPGLKEASRRMKGGLLAMDPPEHSIYRSLLTREFTLRRMKSLRPRIQQIVDLCIDSMLASPTRHVDLVTALSLPVPSLTICELLGVPYDDRELFQQRTMTFMERTSTQEERARAIGEIRDYLCDLVAIQAARPQDTLISRMAARAREQGVYDPGILGGLATLLLIAGFETTANMISLGVAVLLKEPGQRAALAADAALMPKGVQELLRYFSISDQITCRVALHDIEIAGIRIRAGEGIVASTAAANHDPEVFSDPHTLDLHREPHGHLAFGFGIHQCIGHNLARLELEIVYSTLFARIPTLRTARPVEDLPFKKDSLIYGIHSMDVTW